MEPKLYTGEAPVEVTAQIVVGVVKAVIEAGVEEEFVRLCTERNATVRVNAADVNFVKTYLADLFSNRAASSNAMAMRAVDSDRCTPLGGG